MIRGGTVSVSARYSTFPTIFFLFSEGRSSHPLLCDGGAFQISLSRLQLDFYPYHLALGNREAWIRYQEGSVHAAWLANAIKQFQNKLTETVMANSSSNNSSSVAHSPLTRTGAAQVEFYEDFLGFDLRHPNLSLLL